MIGHPQGASGAAGIVTSALALSRRVPAADDQPARARSRTAISTSSPTSAARPSVAAALCNCLGFGSKNSAIVSGRAMNPDPDAQSRISDHEIPNPRIVSDDGSLISSAIRIRMSD